MRLIRAIEIAKALGKVPKITQSAPVYRFIKIGLCLSKEKLKEKIHSRLLARIKMGMIQEARDLHAHGLPFTRMLELGLEYKFMALYLKNKISKEKMLEALNMKIYQYAKRQMTWFKRDPEIKWFDASKKINLKTLLKDI